MPSMVIVNGEVDAIWDTKAQADRERRELQRDLYCANVRVRHFKTWREAEDHADKLRGY